MIRLIGIAAYTAILAFIGNGIYMAALSAMARAASF